MVLIFKPGPLAPESVFFTITSLFLISKGVKLGGDRKIPAIFLSFYVACITIQNPWSQTRNPRTSSRSLRAIMFHHLCTVSYKEIPYLENTDDINNKCLCTRSTIMTNVSFWDQISSNLTVFLKNSLKKNCT